MTTKNTLKMPASCIFSLALLTALLVSCGAPTKTPNKAGLENVNPKHSSLSDPDAATGGRANGLASSSDGQVFYLASEWGGLYTSADMGNTWSHLDAHLPTVTWDVAVDPKDSKHVYATSLYDGRVDSLAGINTSADGGQTWNHPASAAPAQNFCAGEARRQEPSAFGIAIDPDNPDLVYAGSNCGLVVSRDGGVTWAYVDPTPSDLAESIWDVYVHHGGIIDVCGDDGHARSVDGGNTWTSAAGIGLPSGHCSITGSPFEQDVLVAVVGVGLYESDDGGQSWPHVLTNPNPQGRVPFVQVNKRSGSDFDLWFGDVGLYRAACSQPSSGTGPRCPSNTWNGPYTRTVGGHDDLGDILFDPLQEVDACPLMYSSDGGVYINKLTGSPGCQDPSWRQPEVTPNALWVFGMSGADLPGLTPEDLYFGTQDNGTFSERNAGAANPAWTIKNCCDSSDIVATTSHVLYSSCCFSPGRANRLFLRDPGLIGGGEINTYPPGNVPGFRAIDVIATFGTKNYALITTTGVYFTNDISANPITWSQLGTAASTPPQVCNIQASVSAGTPSFIIEALQSGFCNDSLPLQQRQLWRIDGATSTGTWTQITPPGGTGGFGIYAVDPVDPQRLLAAYLQGNADPSMILSTDGGQNWSSMPDLDANMTGNGIFRYRNSRGPTPFTELYGYPQPTFAAFDAGDRNVIMAGGADSGLFLSLDEGITWKLVSDPIHGKVHIPRPQFAYFDHEPAGVMSERVIIYIGTVGRGVWRLYVP
jgi:photosystem II stability/assembly factor-like uncharacterized protein